MSISFIVSYTFSGKENTHAILRQIWEGKNSRSIVWTYPTCVAKVNTSQTEASLSSYIFSFWLLCSSIAATNCVLSIFTTNKRLYFNVIVLWFHKRRGLYAKKEVYIRFICQVFCSFSPVSCVYLLYLFIFIKNGNKAPFSPALTGPRNVIKTSLLFRSNFRVYKFHFQRWSFGGLYV